MKYIILSTVIMISYAINSMADNLIRLNNKDANIPIYLFKEGNLAPVENMFVECHCCEMKAVK